MKKSFSLILGVIISIGTFAISQDVLVEGQNNVFKAIVTLPISVDRVAVQGVSKPQPNYGIGVRGDGGYRGVVGYSDISGPGSRYGVLGVAGNGTSRNYGVYGQASGSVGTRYGVYGYATASGSNYAGYFNGNLAYTGTITDVSDLKFKKNVQDLTGNLKNILKLKPKKYKLKKDEYPSMNFGDKEEFGLIAQDVEVIFPNLVSENMMPASGSDKSTEKLEDDDESNETYKGMDYISLVPVLIGAIQELNGKIEKLEKELASKK